MSGHGHTELLVSAASAWEIATKNRLGSSGRPRSFDRMIAAQCMLESIPLAAPDTSLASFPGIRVIW